MPTVEERYEPVNTIWPETIPSISKEEALRAKRKLLRHFGEGKFKTVHPRVRRCWIAKTPPFNTLSRGWRRLVHDLSHRITDKFRGLGRPHNPYHARIENEMAKYVIEMGWLNGTLKPAPRHDPNPTDIDKLARIMATMKRWETKRKRAETAIKKLRTRVRYYQRKELSCAS